MKLDVPLILQPEDSDDCGPAALAMLCSFHDGGHTSLEDVKWDVPIYESGTYPSQLATYLLDRGFKVRIITGNEHLFEVSRSRKSKDDIIRHLKKQQRRIQKSMAEDDGRYTDTTAAYLRSERRQNDLYLTFLKRGGSIETRPPQIKDLTSELDAGRPSIVNYFVRVDTPREFYAGGHYCVTAGHTATKIHVKDPLEDIAAHSYSHEHLLFKIHSEHGCIIQARK